MAKLRSGAGVVRTPIDMPCLPSAVVLEWRLGCVAGLDPRPVCFSPRLAPIAGT